MQTMIACCWGLDVHKAWLTACVRLLIDGVPSVATSAWPHHFIACGSGAQAPHGGTEEEMFRILRWGGVKSFEVV
jgi:hypothetical protein